MPKRKRELLNQCKASSSPRVTRALKTKSEEDPVCIWVQCENEHCNKWRLISAEEAKGLEESSSWYCWFNRDTRYNTCSAEEQKVKKPKHMKFIYSLLPEGEVVTAKMHGYPPWPGLLTRDPTCGEYYDAPLIKEDEVTHYHVEFFGRPRSRAWLVPPFVHPLRSVNEIEKTPKFRKIQGRQLMELRKSYEFALKEAYNSLSKTTDQRLASCHFKYVEVEEDKRTLAKVSSEQTPVIREQAVKIPGRRNSATSPLNSPTIPIMMKKPWLGDNGSVSSLDWKENEFLERLESFSVDRGVTVPKQPIWRGKRISLFKFYNLVLKHGGFEKIYCGGGGRLHNKLSGAFSILVKVWHPLEIYVTFLSKVLMTVIFPRTNFSSFTMQTPRKTQISLMTAMDPEQTVPGTPGPTPQDSSADHIDNSITNSSHQHNAFRGNDQVPSSNPDSPHQSLGGCSFDSDESDDDSTSSACDEAEKGLQQLERLLLSLEPSLYPSDGYFTRFCLKSELFREQQGEKSLPKSLNKMSTIEEVDVKKTLDEIAKIEGAIADLNSFVSLEMEQL
ncbi:unnamed protein product [Porites evermanni]|uniref:Zinc finger CW-type PWWP domain protein 2 n=1 Tax=Porites evermanni TaxID=104178 RepID=A0ABN8R6K2_9CNID|nr:unnamed protein product [Porites evermanni]